MENIYRLKSDYLLYSRKNLFLHGKILDEAKKDLSCDKKSITRSSHVFSWPNVKISIQDIFALLKPATTKNIFIERENKQANKRYEFLLIAKLSFCSHTKHSPVKTKESRSPSDHTSAKN